MLRCLLVVVISAVVAMSATAGFAATVWSGPPVAFTKQPFADPALPGNQDRLTQQVALTRGSAQGLYNPLREQAYTGTSPAGTRWAFAGLRGNPQTGIAAANYASLNFSTWEVALGGRPSLAGNIVDRPAVVHLVDEDIYLDVTFTDWSIGGGGGGGFSYTRASPAPDGNSEDIPLPLPAVLALGAAVAFAGSRRLARRAATRSQDGDGRPPLA